MRVLVTGGSGFVGTHLIAKLIERNWNIRLAVRVDDANFRIKGECCDYIVVGDINSDTQWEASLRDVDVVVYLAGYAHISNDEFSKIRQRCIDVNTTGPVNLARSAAKTGVKHFIYLSSIGVVCQYSEFTINENTPCNPHNVYAESKWLAENELKGIATTSSMGVTILRPPLVYGPGNPGNFRRLIDVVSKGYPLPLGSITNRRSFLYVKNLVDVILKCIEAPADDSVVYHVSDDQSVSTPELITILAQTMGKKAKLYNVPVSILSGIASVTRHKDDLIRLKQSLELDNTKFKENIDWTPPYTLQEGIKETINWYLVQHGK